MEQFDLNQTICRLLTPQKVLAPWIFDQNEKMIESVRKRLLKIGETLALQTASKVEGLEVFDICLTGSSSGYFYHDKSDIDMRLEIHNTASTAIAQDKKRLDMFLSALHIGRGLRFSLDGHKVDIKICSTSMQDWTSLYSVKDNVWRIKPNKDMIKDLTVKALTDYYQKRKAEILKEFESLKAKYTGVKLGDALNDFYIQLVLQTENIKDYYVFKLLNYEKILKPIGAASIEAYNSAIKAYFS